MGTQTSVLFCCLTVLSRRLKIGAVQTVFESSLIDECQHGRVFVTIFIIRWHRQPPQETEKGQPLAPVVPD